MIVGIEGTVDRKEPTFVHLNVSGIIYEVQVSINTSSNIADKKVKLFVTQVIREDAHLLFGFMELNEKKMFDTVLKINGVGPKVGLAICSTFTPETFAKVVASKDVSMLKRVPGVGPKAASRILVELADFIVDGNIESASSGAMSDAMMALESLGFKKDVIQKALVGATGDTSSLVKEGLKRLQRL
ncbi:MAG TPA: Holliday junction branch migration protein RuvA [Sulfurovum sp.]|jgi:Holliday junction DNA helicase RuvA|nr:MAG: Holliday junction branch migration protein RuvA [Sulfurovum sp. 35-42-20]OYZ25635.1 MAG: Holliday junction branch migration protein RuvA [Sulfurovum sp. 16-42-52]OYZ49744.1 MAG: Holliday junction branch migration protein RuvA [Sulfurovum sp. 24-42-9]OZA45753.1 MAG: Holliday junction branch migration protein RuvA [Sulfurovum sp. 17-42-90]OZA59729.1 MAG: Holliday junction branch migration protein RuvA [Sulfurovum sp. 39-42-12]HQR73864.1 Holliday junction branch migration protein RuvA [Su